MIEVAVQAEPGWDDGTDWEKLATEAVAAAIRISPFAEMLTAAYMAEVSIRLTDDAEVQALDDALTLSGASDLGSGGDASAKRARTVGP